MNRRTGRRQVAATTTTDQTIIDATLLLLDKHLHNHERPMRALVDNDFERIKAVKRTIAQSWYQRDSSEQDNYHAFRGRLLDSLATKHRWHTTTRNLYGSILSKLTVWEQHGVSANDLTRLEQLRPGAELFLQFLCNREQPLL